MRSISFFIICFTLTICLPTACQQVNKTPGSMAVSDIKKVQFNEVLYGTSPKSSNVMSKMSAKNLTITTTSVEFSKDGTAVKISDILENDEKGAEKNRQKIEYTGTIAQDQFARLAEVLIENDFFNRQDSRETVTDANNYNLKITYSGINGDGIKRIETNNTGKDTPEIEAILQAFANLQNQVVWKQVK